MVLAYDITRMDTFLNLETWLREVKQQTDPQTVIVLLGNMSDKEEHREVTQQQAEEFRAKHKIAFWIETSAKTGSNVEDLFLLAAKLVYFKNKDKIGLMKDQSQNSK